jgi:hypothetical protein
MANDPPSVVPSGEHPLAVWLHRVADNLDRIFVCDREADDLPWRTVALDALPHPVAAAYVADFLQRWPFTPDIGVRPEERDTCDQPLPRTHLTLDNAREKLAGWHFNKARLSEREQEILDVAEALLRELERTTP